MILVTGGLGFIGSHFTALCLQAGYDVLVIDNLSNSSEQVKPRIEKAAGRPFVFEKGDLRDPAFLNHVFSNYSIDSVVHFAGLKAVGESVEKPRLYYQNNVQGTFNLLEAMQSSLVKRIIFSSSATVYGEPQYLPYDEAHPKAPVNPYGRTKSMVEDVLEDECNATPDFTAISLRYFNPVGAHPSGLLGEEPNGLPNNLMPFLVRVAAKALPKLTVFGGDYATKDGSGERDYIHVMDLARGHMLALNYLEKTKGYSAINLGSGTPVSVLQMIQSFEATNKVTVNYEIGARRSGDLPAFWANPSLAKELLGFETKLNLEDMVKDSWEYQRNTLDAPTQDQA